MPMTNEEIAEAVERVIALRPQQPSMRSMRSISHECHLIETAKRKREMEYQQEMKAINQGEHVSRSLYYFNNIDVTKVRAANPAFCGFNPTFRYRDK
ncbi:MAG: hypothetical protein ACK5NL_11850 [Vibrio fluvialis]